MCDAIIHLIDNPDAQLADIMAFVKGPDFPTGAIINGTQGIIEAYTTGRGRIKVRAKTHFEEMKNGKTSIIVDEIPYQINKAELVKAIADLVKDKVVAGITDLRDESACIICAQLYRCRNGTISLVQDYEIGRASCRERV